MWLKIKELNTSGVYKLRDPIFGWGPIEIIVFVDALEKRLKVIPVHDPTNPINLNELSYWLEYREF